MHHDYRTEMVCSSQIHFDLNGNVVSMTVEQIEGYLKGNLCGQRPTSCADQLARAVRKAYDEEQKGA